MLEGRGFGDVLDRKNVESLLCGLYTKRGTPMHPSYAILVTTFLEATETNE